MYKGTHLCMYSIARPAPFDPAEVSGVRESPQLLPCTNRACLPGCRQPAVTTACHGCMLAVKRGNSCSSRTRLQWHDTERDSWLQGVDQAKLTRCSLVRMVSKHQVHLVLAYHQLFAFDRHPLKPSG